MIDTWQSVSRIVYYTAELLTITLLFSRTELLTQFVLILEITEKFPWP